MRQALVDELNGLRDVLRDGVTLVVDRMIAARPLWEEGLRSRAGVSG